MSEKIPNPEVPLEEQVILAKKLKMAVYERNNIENQRYLVLVGCGMEVFESKNWRSHSI